MDKEENNNLTNNIATGIFKGILAVGIVVIAIIAIIWIWT